jgi:3'(2'), 5'-bisphosphate nucleotidase
MARRTLQARAVSRDLDALAPEIAKLAERAAKAILDVYESDFAVQHKDDRSPLTAADLAAHHLIVDGLAALTPEIPVLSEESSGIAWATRSTWTRYWLVDPLDGTREFVKRNGEFTVNIALIDDHEPVLGVVQTPVGGELAVAWRGGGSWIGTPGGKPRRAKTRPRASPLVIAGSRSHASERETELLARLGHSAKLPLGSSLKFLRIAAGDADLYLRLGPTSEWDTAAGQCVLEEAGGVVLDMRGEPLRYNTRESVLNPDFVAIGDADADFSALFAGP